MRKGRSWPQVSLPILIFVICSTAQDNCDGVCGRRPLASSHGGLARIIGGTDALPGTWPWMVSFCKVHRNQLSHFCGGSLIGSRWIISATHCFLKNNNLKELRALVGITSFANPGREFQLLHIKRLINHKSYHRGNNNDITLVELDEPARCNDYIQPACLPDRAVDVPSLTHCYISGWGVMNVTTKQTSHILKEAKVNLIPPAICNSSGWLHTLIKPDCLCAGFEEGGVDTCQGDSGGPLMCREARSERFWVVGITSFGSGCASAKKPGVYTATQKFIDWITTQSGQNFYKPVHLPVALTAPKPKHPTEAQPQQQRQPRPPSPVRPQPQPAVRPWPQSRPQPSVRPQPQPWLQSPVRPWPQPLVWPQPQPWPPSPVRPRPLPPVHPWPQSRPPPTVRPQPQPQPPSPVRPWPQPPVRPWPQSRPPPTVRPQPQPWSQSPVQPQPQPWPRPTIRPHFRPRPRPTVWPWLHYSHSWPQPLIWLQTRPRPQPTVRPWSQQRPWPPVRP